MSDCLTFQCFFAQLAVSEHLKKDFTEGVWFMNWPTDFLVQLDLVFRPSSSSRRYRETGGVTERCRHGPSATSSTDGHFITNRSRWSETMNANKLQAQWKEVRGRNVGRARCWRHQGERCASAPVAHSVGRCVWSIQNCSSLGEWRTEMEKPAASPELGQIENLWDQLSGPWKGSFMIHYHCNISSESQISKTFC